MTELEHMRRAAAIKVMIFDVDGVLIAKNNNELLSQASLVLPLSSSLAVVNRNDGTLDICRRTSL